MNAPAMNDREVEDIVARWWEWVAAERIYLRNCLACGGHWLPWSPYCPDCGPGPDAAWALASGRGTLYSWVGIHHSVSAPADVPFTIASVRLDEGAMLYGRLSHPDRPLVGDEVVLAQFDFIGGRVVVSFRTLDHPGA